ncbi:MAG: hypothetical protein ACRDFX_14470 [Chloroflexota bacterium]
MQTSSDTLQHEEAIRLSRRFAGLVARCLFAALAVVLLPASRAPALASNTVLRVFPQAGRNGDPFFVSGSGFLPFKRLILLVGCPRWDAPGALLLGNVQLLDGPTTNQFGDFAGWGISGFQLRGPQQSSCLIYARYPDAAPFASDFPAIYSIGNAALIRHAHSIRGTVVTRPSRVRAGLKETVRIENSWGGATAMVVLSYGKHVVKQRLHLDYKGQGQKTLTVPVDSSAASTARARIAVYFQQGPYRGRASASFTVSR